MKKLFTLIFTVALTIGIATAGTPAEMTITPAKIGVRNSTTHLKKPTARINSARIAPDKDPINEPQQWVDMGIGTYTDDILTCWMFFDGIEPCTYEVRVQEDKANPGIYRIIDPWANYPNTAAIEEQGGELTLGDEVYITLDARDSQFVRLLRSPLGMADYSGPTEVIGYSEAYGIDEDILDEQLDMHGTLENGIITFPDETAIGIIQADETEDDGDYIYNTNQNGAFKLCLPGAQNPIDYTVTLYYTETLCPSTGSLYHVQLGGDNRIASVKYIITTDMTDQETVVLEVLNSGTEAHIGDIVTIDLSDENAPIKYLVVISFDEKGEPQKAQYGKYSHPDANAEEWVYKGKAMMTEGLLSCLTYAPFTSEEFEVEVEENKYLANYFRIKNPYAKWSQTQAYLTSCDHNHYLYVNAYYPEDVYIEYSPLGVDVSVFGKIAVSSDYYSLILTYGHDVLAGYGIHSGGTFENNIITFNNRNDIRVLCTGLENWYYTNRLENPDYDKSDETSEPYIAGPFKLDLSKASGIDTVTDNKPQNAEPEYFNLMGVRIDSDYHGIAIRRIGNKVEKVVIK